MTSKGQGTYNVVVIGAGSAGLVTAAGTAGLGGRVALIEKGPMGGDCLNTGCVPSKSLIASARLMQAQRDAHRVGLRDHEPDWNFHEVMDSMRARRARIAPNDSQERFESLGVDVFRGAARFTSPHEVEVVGLDGELLETLKAEHIVISAGSAPAAPPIEGLAEAGYFTNETIFDDMQEHPRRLAVLGGGPIGCELGQAFARLKAVVTIFEHGPRLLSKEDEETSALLERVLEREGVTLKTGCEVRRAERRGEAITLIYDEDGHEKQYDVDTVLVAAGRRSDFSPLVLEKAGVETDEGGHLKLNSHLQTTVPHIFAAGDAAGPFRFTHMADHQARVVVENILKRSFPTGLGNLLLASADHDNVPWCTYTDPEVATLALTEQMAQSRGLDYDTYRVELAHLDRAVTEGATEGFAKVLTRRGSGEILGVTIVAPGAGELLAPFALAKKNGLGLDAMAGLVLPYPTLAEMVRKLGDEYRRTKLTPMVEKAFRWAFGRGADGKVQDA
ncbi:MAG: mercuric reductase [Sumerlaeia bacterium]